LFKASDITNQGQGTLTKRVILSKVARIYDPIGLASAFLIRAKIAIQQVCQLGIGWDEELPPTIRDQWIKLFHEMTELNHVSFARGLFTISTHEHATLCTLSDTSKDAFGAGAYIRQRGKGDKYEVKLIAAKYRGRH